MGDAETTVVEDALKKSGLEDRVKEMKCGIETNLTKEFDPEGEVLSGGEIQKMAIARGLAKSAKIMIMDEPSSALDPLAEADLFKNGIQEYFKKQKNGCISLFISHRMYTAKMADRIFFLQDGEIMENGSHSELMRQDGKYAVMYRLQAASYLMEEEEVCHADK